MLRAVVVAAVLGLLLAFRGDGDSGIASNNH